MTENRIFTLCRMITWVVFLRMFWNFISSLPVKRGGGSLSFLTIFTFAIPELLDLIWRKIGFFTLCRMITGVVFLRMFWNFISSLPVKRGGSLSFLVGTISNVLVMEIGWTDVGSGGYIYSSRFDTFYRESRSGVNMPLKPLSQMNWKKEGPL
jgi:hypothetical protein